MNGIVNFLTFIKENWTLITTIAGLLLWIFVKVSNYIKLSREEKIDAALSNIKVIMLGLVTEMEQKWGSKTGQIKRSQAIKEIFDKYPILKEITNQDEIVMKIDDMIDESLDSMKEILENK
jgi:hypothetical protein